MNREIKFRAWHKKLLSWVTGGVISLEGKYCGAEPLNMQVSQFSGLQDKNGKDIYEGDIVRFHYFYGSFGEGMGFEEAEHELTGIVKWGAFGWGVDAIKGEHWCGYTGYKDYEGSSNFLDLMAMNESSVHEESFEIIGNVYEHPHLLTKQ